MSIPVVGFVRHGAGKIAPLGSPDVELKALDIYELLEADLSTYSGLFISSWCDQRALAANKAKLSAWVKEGGRLLFNGHPILPFIEQCPSYRKMFFEGVTEIWLSAVDKHPLWEGIDRRDVLMRTGVPGCHSFEEMKSIGVAGFYSRAYLVNVPKQASVITGIGPYRLPVDISYPLGEGEIIIHNGLDLVIFNAAGNTSEDWSHRIIRYLGGINVG